MLSGHGTTWQGMSRTPYQRWLEDVESAYAKLKEKCEAVFVSGLSMGGALALYLAEQHPEIAGVVPINHAIFLQKDWRLALLPLFKHLVPYVEAVGNDIKDPEAEELTYTKTPTKAVHQLIKLLVLVRADLEKVAQPCLIFKSKEDHVIPAECAEETYARISSPKKKAGLAGQLLSRGHPGFRPGHYP